MENISLNKYRLLNFIINILKYSTYLSEQNPDLNTYLYKRIDYLSLGLPTYFIVTA